MLKKYFLDIMSKDAPGLYLCEVPTGIGKSYQAAQAMREYAKTTKKKIIYLTPLIKNVRAEAEELRKAYGDDDVFENEVLIIPSNKDQIVSIFSNKNKSDTLYIPVDKKPVNYDKLTELATQYRVSKGKAKEFCEKEFLKEEQKFRGAIWKILEKIPQKERLKKIKEDKNYQWIGKLYPAVFTEEKKILLLTVSKFLYKNSVIIRPSYDFIRSDIVKDSVVFIDEFDDSKEVIWSHILEESYKTKVDYLALFHQLYTNMDETHFDTRTQQSLQKVDTLKGGNGSRYIRLKKEAEAIEKEFHLELNYKTVGDSGEDKPQFLFYDGEIVTSADDSRPIRGRYNEENNQVQLFYANEAQQADDSLLRLDKLLERLHAFFYHFRLLALEWAAAYANQINSSRPNDAMAFEENDALSTLLDCFYLTEKQKDFFFNEINKTKQVTESGTSFYEKGFEYFRFEDSDRHLNKTDIVYVGVHETPEKLLCYLANRATIIGLSASAEFSSILCNYNLSYLQEKLKEKYHETTDSLKKFIRQELKHRYKPYETRDIRVHPVCISDKEFDFSLPLSAEINIKASTFFKNNETKKVFFEKMKLVSKDYVKCRYLAIIKVMHEFFEIDSIKSLLCLESLLPGEGKADWDKSILVSMFSSIRKDYKQAEDEAFLYILTSEDFSNKKKAIDEALSCNKKVMILSAYQTLGSGQNLQYVAPDVDKLISLTMPGSSKKKDLDAIYLGNITNVIPHISYSDYFTQEENNELSKINRITKVKELQTAEYEFSRDWMIKEIKKTLGGKQKLKKENDKFRIYELPSVKAAVSRTILQAVGRMCRTKHKNPDIYLFVHEQVVQRVDTICFIRREGLIPPELSKIPFAEWRKTSKSSSNPLHNKNVAYRYSRYTSLWEDRLQEMMGGKNGFTKKSKKDWEDVRVFLLKHPTSNEDSTFEYLPYYIQREQPFNHYLFRQYESSEGNKEFSSTEYDFIAPHKKGWSGVGEKESKLLDILKYPGMRKYFERMGYATSFETAKGVLNPVLFRNVYKGALGEVAGRFILEDALPNFHISPIENVKHFEKFDFMLPDYKGVYIDFKNWNEQTMDKDWKEEIEHIRDKMQEIEATLVFVINIVAKDVKKYRITETGDNAIVPIPALIDSDGILVKSSIEKIMTRLQKYKEE